MRPFCEIDGRIARWEVLERSAHAYTLRSGMVPFALLRWERADGSIACAGVNERGWIFEHERGGRRVLVRDVANGHRFAALDLDWRGAGHLECESGASAEWHSATGARAHWGFRTASGLALVEIRLDATPWAAGALVVFAPDAAHTPEAGLLATLGWHLALHSLQGRRATGDRARAVPAA